MKNIVAVIPTFNRKDHLCTILTQLEKQVLLNNINLIIVVIVDGSKDGTFEMLELNFPSIHIIKGNGNWWYTKSMNEGFKFAQKFNPYFILTLNDDLEIDECYLTNLISDYYSLDNKRCILGSLSVSNEINPRVLFSGVKLEKRKRISYFPFLKQDLNSSIRGVHKSIELPGRGILIPNDILNELDYFDETFPQYGSDTDFCFRAQDHNIGVFVSWNAHVKVNLKTTRIRSQSGVNSLRLKINDLFNIYSHKSLSLFVKFNVRHYGYLNLIWRFPKFLIHHFLRD